MVDAPTARHLYQRLEPLHGFIYFSSEAAEEYATLGLTGQDGYFASRAAAMGAVGPEVVIATFFNFQPHLVRNALPAAWDITTPAEVLAARLRGADATLRRVIGEAEGVSIDDAELAEAAALARTAAEACRHEGRPLYAAHAALPWPVEPHLQLFHAVTLLREHRGDGHVAALTLENLDNGDVLVTHAASDDFGLPDWILQRTRGFSDEEWAAAKDRVRARGLIDDEDRLTAEGKELRQRIEDRTDAAALPPWQALGDEGCARLLEVARPYGRAVLKSGIFGGPPG
ncbi:hypothetical protein HC251_16020 [Iamia sp. SCSIO 61187]|uniref:SCO6745 family protein n=1 Tax=Iamia sp. SCSIO 61187 TaxID=2722752 RepID=UPI001C624F98|nr:hypothetical protein [Iamia sp. SCSIO 61187]QYG93783.1 hypothetical protein HC251_16020 [Iamia sp. SCSIO 61187]